VVESLAEIHRATVSPKLATRRGKRPKRGLGGPTLLRTLDTSATSADTKGVSNADNGAPNDPQRHTHHDRTRPGRYVATSEALGGDRCPYIIRRERSEHTGWFALWTVSNDRGVYMRPTFQTLADAKAWLTALPRTWAA
jgi:hypothetical protein